MKLTKFQSRMRDLARIAFSIGALQDFQLEQYEDEDSIRHFNPEGHDYIFSTLVSSINRAYAYKEEEGQLSEAERFGKQEAARLIGEYRACQRMKRISCPPALQFALWEKTKAARAMRAIKNREVRSIRKQMRDADIALLRGLINYVEKAIEKQTKWKALVKEENRRESCPPKEAFSLWEAAKQARQMRLITNAQVRECRDTRNWGSNLEIAEMRADIAEKIYRKQALLILKNLLKRQQEERDRVQKRRYNACI